MPRVRGRRKRTLPGRVKHTHQPVLQPSTRFLGLVLDWLAVWVEKRVRVRVRVRVLYLLSTIQKSSIP
jgi:hypothetical protein